MNPALAENWYKEGSPDQGDNMGGVDGFGAMLMMTSDAEQALKNWLSPPEDGFHVSTNSVVERNVPIEALIVFSGCTPNSQGNCDAEVDYLITAPDGSVYGDFKNTELWRHKPAVPTGKLGLAVDRISVRIEDGELLGEYLVSCTVRDLVAGVSFGIKSTFEVVESVFPEDA